MGIPRFQDSVWKQDSMWMFVCDITIASGAAMAGGTTVFRFWSDGRKGLAFISAVGTLLAVAFTIVRSGLQYQERIRKRAPHDLVGCLHTLRGVLEASADVDSDPGLRVTLYVPVEQEQALEQACDYSCNDPVRMRKTGGRKMPWITGVIGRAYQQGKTAVAKRTKDDPKAHIQDLVESWGFSAESARAVDSTVCAWMAVPLGIQAPGSDVITDIEAVLYIDSQLREFFSERRQLLVFGGCGALALFAHQRYNS